MMRMPASPSTSITVRPRLRRSPRTSMASTAAHTGMVNSIANTVASGSIAIAYTQAYCPPKCSTLRTQRFGLHVVRNVLHFGGQYTQAYCPPKCSTLRTTCRPKRCVRNVLHFGGQYAWVYAIAMLPLATVFAIEFTMPVWAAVLAMLVLGERLNRGRTVMLVLGLAGILIILRPGFGVVQPAALVMLAGSFAYASTMVATKRLSQNDSAFAILF